MQRKHKTWSTQRRVTFHTLSGRKVRATVPEEWTAPFVKGLRTSLDGYPRVTVDELAARTAIFIK